VIYANMTRNYTKISIPENILYRKVGDESVIVNLESGKNYSLDQVGTRMWTLLAENGQVEPVIHTLLEEFDVEPERLRRDLLDLIDALAQLGLVEVGC